MRPAFILPQLLLLPLTVFAASDMTITRHRDLLIITAPADRIAVPAAVLSTPMSVDFQETPLDDAVALIARATGLNTVVDPTLRANGTTVTLRAEQMAAGNVLRWIEQTSGIYVDWIDSALFFSAEPARRPRVTRTYDVADLVLRMPDFPGPELAFNAQGTGLPGVSFLAPVERPDAAPTHDDLIDLIEGVVKGR